MPTNTELTRPHDRPEKLSGLCACALLILGFMQPAMSSGLNWQTIDHQSVLIDQSGDLLYQPSGLLENARAVPLDNTGTELLLWQEREDHAIRSYFAVSDEGGLLGRIRNADYTIHLRSESFDPYVTQPQIHPALSQGLGGRLFLVQLWTTPLPQLQGQLLQNGARVIYSIPNFSLVVDIDPAQVDALSSLPFVRWVGQYHPQYRLEPELQGRVISTSPGNGDIERYSLMLADRSESTRSAVHQLVDDLGGAIEDSVAGTLFAQASLTSNQLMQLLTDHRVVYVDRWGGPPQLDMNRVREHGGANHVESVEGFTGQGVNAEVYDSGFRDTHQAWLNPPLRHSPPAQDGSTDHGTKVASSLFARGLDPDARGVIPDAQAIFISYNNPGLSDTAIHQQLLDPMGPYRAVLQTRSFGTALTTSYTTESAAFDDLLFNYQLLTTQSQSNDGTQNSRPQAWAKNAVSVGGIYHFDNDDSADDTWALGASIGPAADGRVKPDLAFYFDSIRAADDGADNDYIDTFGGTSSATPQTAGYFGLLFQMWHEGVWSGFGGDATVFDSRPKMATAKALMIHHADRYDWNVVGNNSDLDRFKQGWGRASARNLYDHASETVLLIDETEPLLPLGMYSTSIDVWPNSDQLKVTLVYTDPAGVPAASVHRINDLSLRLTSPTGVIWWGNNGLASSNESLPGGSSNTIDTVENVFITSPEAGQWAIEVLADDVVVDSHTETVAIDADFALVGSRLHSDNAPPAAPSFTPTPDFGTWSNDPSVMVTWSGADDGPGGSGITGYSIAFDQIAANPVDELIDISHGSDPHSTSSGALADGTDHYFHLAVCDNAGYCSSTQHVGPFMVDATAPSTPGTVSSTSHGDGNFHNDANVDIEWLAAIDATSGVDGYAIEFDTQAVSACSEDKDVEEPMLSTTSGPLPDGLWYAHVCAVDNADNWGPVAHGGPFRVDLTEPAAPTGLASASHGDGLPHADTTIELSWAASTDALSGVDGYGVVFDLLASGSCDNIKDLEGNQLDVVSSALPDGHWYAHLCAVDNAGNWSTAAHAGPFIIDTTAPSGLTLSSSSHSASTWSNQNALSFSFDGASDANGVAGYALAFDQSPASDPGCTVDQAGIGHMATASADANDWWLHVRAIDNAENCSNVVHSGPYWVDTTSPSAPSPLSSSSHNLGEASSDNTIDVSWTASSDNLSGVSGYSIAFDTQPLSACAMTADVATPVTSFSSTELADGNWYVHVCASDNAGNWSVVTHNGPYVIDRSGPIGLSIASTSHASSTWSSSTELDFSFSGATDDTGLAGYAVSFDQTPSSNPACTLDQAASTYQAAASSDGADWWLHVRAVDTLSNCGDVVHSGPYWIDSASPVLPAPITSASHGDGLPTTDTTIDITWTAAADTLSGIDGYGITFDTNASSACVMSQDVGSSTLSQTSAALSDGTWYAHVCAVDAAGNWSETADGGPYLIDTTGPSGLTVESSSHNTSNWTSNATVDFDFSGAVDSQGIAGYAIVFDQHPATDPGCAVDQAATSYQAMASDDGNNWWLHVRAIDNLNNCGTAVHSGPYWVDTTAPPIPVANSSTHGNGPSSLDQMLVEWTSVADLSSGLAGYGWELSTLPVQACSEQLAGDEFTTQTSFEPADGDWYFHFCAVDQVGNWSSASHAGAWTMDRVGPQLNSVDTVADIAAGFDTTTPVNAAVTQILASFSETMATSGPGSVLSVDNWKLLRAGDSGEIRSTECSAISTDDEQIAVGSIEFDSSLSIAALALDTRGLASGRYRLLVCPSITDVAGNALGQSSGQVLEGGTTADFSLRSNPVLINPNFGNGLAPWAPSPGSTGQWSHIDVDVDTKPFSGSAEYLSPAFGTGILQQCVELSDLESQYRFSSSMRLQSTEPERVQIEVAAEWFDGAACNGSSLGQMPLSSQSGTVNNDWFSATATPIQLPDRTVSVLMSFEVNNSSSEQVSLGLDEVFFAADPDAIFWNEFE